MSQPQSGGAVTKTRLARMNESLFDELRRRLLDGVYPPDEPLSVNDLRAEFSVSRQPVMDAIRNLAAIGLVEIIPQVGCIVKRYTVDDLRDLLTLVAAVEGNIARIAAERRTDEQIQAMRAVLDSAVHAPAHGVSEVELSRFYRDNNLQFHGSVHVMAHSDLLTRESERLWNLTDFLVQQARSLEWFAHTIDRRHDEHLHIAEAIERRDADEAEQITRSHLMASVRDLPAEDAVL